LENVYPVPRSCLGRDLVQHAVNRNNASAKLLFKGFAFAAFAGQALEATSLWTQRSKYLSVF
jgi:hypothetical protein